MTINRISPHLPKTWSREERDTCAMMLIYIAQQLNRIWPVSVENLQLLNDCLQCLRLVCNPHMPVEFLELNKENINEALLLFDTETPYATQNNPK